MSDSDKDQCFEEMLMDSLELRSSRLLLSDKHSQHGILELQSQGEADQMRFSVSREALADILKKHLRELGEDPVVVELRRISDLLEKIVNGELTRDGVLSSCANQIANAIEQSGNQRSQR